MHSRSALIIYGLYFLLMLLGGCETVKGAAKGTAEGFSKDYENTKDNIKQAYENTKKGIKKTYEGTQKTAKKTDEWIRENLW